MATGGHRSVTFGKLEQPRPGEQVAETRATDVNPLLLLGELMRGHAVVGEQLRGLHLDASRYHGSLQVIRSALRRMDDNISAMILECEK
jgi:hypothetical protein